MPGIHELVAVRLWDRQCWLGLQAQGPCNGDLRSRREACPGWLHKSEKQLAFQSSRKTRAVKAVSSASSGAFQKVLSHSQSTVSVCVFFIISVLCSLSLCTVGLLGNGLLKRNVLAIATYSLCVLSFCDVTCTHTQYDTSTIETSLMAMTV